MHPESLHITGKNMSIVSETFDETHCQACFKRLLCGILFPIMAY